MITTEQAIALARECGGNKGANIKGDEFCVANWCSEPNGECDCEELEVQCAKPTKGVYLSDNALTALCNLAYQKGLEDAHLAAQKMNEGNKYPAPKGEPE